MRSVARHIFRVAVLVTAAGLICAFLVRYSPGSLVDERELNQRLGEDSLAALRLQKAGNANVGANFVRYLRGLSHGDLGYSESNNAPIAELVADRAPATLRELGTGLFGGWALGLGLAVLAGRFRGLRLCDAASGAAAGLLLSLPPALLAYLCLSVGAASGAVLVLVLAPRVFRFSRNLLMEAYATPHVEMARARGISESGILCRHVLPDAAPQLLALLAASVSMGIGAAIPVEAICDAPGLGRLAWRAAMARDLPLLVNLTMLVTLATTAAMLLAQLATPKHVVAEA
jgi:peptide/nickel transport system permease protein